MDPTPSNPARVHLAATRSQRPLAGVSLAVTGYLLFTLQDAAVKWLVTDYSVWQVLFTRSLVIACLCVAIGRGALVARALASPRKPALLGRGVVIIAAWLCFYTASRELDLAELTTLYFAAPLVVTVLSVWVLRERVGWWRWLGVLVGFAGVVLAVEPGAVGFTRPVMLTLVAACLWATASILVRHMSAHETTLVQMLFSNGAFIVACGLTLPWTGAWPSAGSLGLMVLVGVVGAGAQFTLFEGLRHAPASLVAPFEYSALLWAFLLAFLVWGDVPRAAVWGGAALIAASGVGVLLAEWWSGRRAARP